MFKHKMTGIMLVGAARHISKKILKASLSQALSVISSVAYNKVKSMFKDASRLKSKKNLSSFLILRYLEMVQRLYKTASHLISKKVT